MTRPGPIIVTDPAPLPRDDRCPECGAGPERRIVSEAFGPVHDVCGECGHDFDELTLPVADDGDDEEAGA